MYKIYYTKQALKDVGKLKNANLSERAKKLIDLIRENPYKNPPQYEKLIGKLDGILSRRLNLQHRLVYQVEESPFIEDGTPYQGKIKIIRMWTHYEDIE